MIEKMKIKDFSEQELKSIHNIMQRTWDYIAPDVLQCAADDPDARDYDVTMKKSEVIEVTLDASYMEMQFGRKSPEKELLQKFRRLDYNDQINVAKQTFKFKSYGY